MTWEQWINSKYAEEQYNDVYIVTGEESDTSYKIKGFVFGYTPAYLDYIPDDFSPGSGYELFGMLTREPHTTKVVCFPYL